MMEDNVKGDASHEIRTCTLADAVRLLKAKSLGDAGRILERAKIMPYAVVGGAPHYVAGEIESLGYERHIKELERKTELLESEVEALSAANARVRSLDAVLKDLEVDEIPEEWDEREGADAGMDPMAAYDELRENFLGLRENMIRLVLERMGLRKENEGLKDRLADARATDAYRKEIEQLSCLARKFYSDKFARVGLIEIIGRYRTSTIEGSDKRSAGYHLLRAAEAAKIDLKGMEARLGMYKNNADKATMVAEAIRFIDYLQEIHLMQGNMAAGDVDKR